MFAGIACGRRNAIRFGELLGRGFKEHKKSQLGCFSQECRSYSYEGDGKTTVTILNKESDAPLMIDAYSQVGFRLNNGMNVIGPMAIFPKSVLSWNVNSIKDVNLNSLSLFLTLEPRLDILVIGCGDLGEKLDTDVIAALRNRKMNVEILTSDNACTTFNFLNNEKRAVAAAIIPPKNIQFLDPDIMATQKRRKQLYEDISRT